MGKSTEILSRAQDWIDSALDSPDGPVILTSPFLSWDVCERIANAAGRSSESFTLFTALDASAVANGYLSVRGLQKLLDANVHLLHVERLHAKLFIAGSRAMLGSANLTGAGLGTSVNANRELGVVLDDSQTKEALRQVNDWPARAVTAQDLHDLLERSRRITAYSASEGRQLDSDSALSLAERLLDDARDEHRTLWLKLEYGDPALEEWREDSYFASPKKGRPSFKAGDLVFVCANDTKDCYAVVEVVSEAEFQPDDYLDDLAGDDASAERWPWINRTKPRLVPDELMQLKLNELGVPGNPLQNGHVRLSFDQFTAGVRALARLATE